jgi:hypothetical protein
MVLQDVVATRERPYGPRVIEVRGVSKRYDEKPAVDDLAFPWYRGTCTEELDWAVCSYAATHDAAD